MSFMHRFCCCGAGCPTYAREECVDCEEAVPQAFTLLSSSIVMCVVCVLPPGGGFYADYSEVPANATRVLVYDVGGVTLGEVCLWFGGSDPESEPFDIDIYTNSACENFQGTLNGNVEWYLVRGSTKWSLEGHVIAFNPGGGSPNWYGIFFYGELDIEEGDCLGPLGPFTNTLGSCGDIFNSSPLFGAGGPLNGFTDYPVVGTGGTATLVCNEDGA